MLRELFVVFVLLNALVVCEEVCFQPCGCFNDEYPFDDRNLPESPEEQELNFLLYTSQNRDDPVSLDYKSNTIPSVFDPKKRTTFFAHGWNTLGLTRSMEFYKEHYLSKGYDHNIILIDWPEGASDVIYIDSASNSRVPGACAAHLSRQLVRLTGARLADFHCLGFSLGAHVCSYMGKFLNGTIGRVTGIDAASPWFDKNDTRLRIDKTDAIFQDNIHTNSHDDEFIRLGIEHPLGHVDFFPNKGGSQPPCEDFGCDHGIGNTYYINSLTPSVCNFTAYPCASDADADAGKCETCTEGVNCQRLGYYAPTMPGRGSFFLKTSSESPYCLN